MLTCSKLHKGGTANPKKKLSSKTPSSIQIWGTSKTCLHAQMPSTPLHRAKVVLAGSRSLYLQELTRIS